MIQADLTIILPEIVLALYAMAALLGAVYTTKDGLAPACLDHGRSDGPSGNLDRVAIRVRVQTSPSTACSSMTALPVLPRWPSCCRRRAVLVMSQEYMARRDLLRFEYPLLVALAAVGMMMMVSAGDLMSLVHGPRAAVAVALCRGGTAS